MVKLRLYQQWTAMFAVKPLYIKPQWYSKVKLHSPSDHVCLAFLPAIHLTMLFHLLGLVWILCGRDSTVDLVSA